MDVLNKTIKKLSEEEYQALLLQVSGKKKNKPYIVLETTRQRDVADSEMMELLQVNASTYYTLKSRLNSKIAAILSKNVQNPISTLIDEVTRVPANLYGSNKDFSIRALKELEKQLIEYDLSSELIIVYKTLAQLHLFDEQFEYYDNLYKKHVAFSLAVSKAEGLFYQFLKKSGNYLLTGNPADLSSTVVLKNEISNICELYNSHRLYVIYNLVKLYHMCIADHSSESLKAKELEIESILLEMCRIFQKYHMDTFYQNIKFLADFLFFQYYQKTGNQVRADHYHEKAIAHLPEICSKHFMSFHVVRLLEGKVLKFIADQNIEALVKANDVLGAQLDIDANETYQFVTYKKFLAICRFYQRDYNGAAKTINDLRNRVSLKQYLKTDVECKLFQALQYCIMGEDGLCLQIISSLKRQIRETDLGYENIRQFIKLIKTAMKPADYRRKVKKITEMWNEFQESNHGPGSILQYVVLDEITIRKMTNPIKD
jgi:Fe2+ or Zn2+ uptake regulation protein